MVYEGKIVCSEFKQSYRISNIMKLVYSAELQYSNPSVESGVHCIFHLLTGKQMHMPSEKIIRNVFLKHYTVSNIMKMMCIPDIYYKMLIVENGVHTINCSYGGTQKRTRNMSAVKCFCLTYYIIEAK